MKSVFLALILLLVGAWFFVFNKERKLQSEASDRLTAAEKQVAAEELAHSLPPVSDDEIEAAPKALPPTMAGGTPPQLSQEQLDRLEAFKNDPKTQAQLQSPPDFIPPPPPSDMEIPPMPTLSEDLGN